MTEQFIHSYTENEKKDFQQKYTEEFKLRGFCGDMILQLPDFNEKTGNFDWNKFEQPLVKDKKDLNDDLLQ